MPADASLISPPAPAGGSLAPSGAPSGGLLSTPPPPSPTPAPGSPPVPSSGAVQSRWWDGWIKPDGSLERTAYDKLPEPLKGFRPVLERFNTFDEMVQSHQHAQSLIGKKGLLPLSETATDAEKKEFDSCLREALRVPEKPDGYGIKRPAEIPEGKWNEGLAKSMSELFHKHAVAPQAVQSIVQEFNRLSLEAETAAEQQRQTELAKAMEEGKAKLKAAWGYQQPQMEQLAIRGAKTLGIDPTSPLFTNNAEVLIACAKFASLVGEDKLIREDSSGRTAIETVESAKDEMRRMATDESHPMFRALKERRGDAITRYQHLADIIASAQSNRQ